jgi:hypothetical protein
MYIPGRFRTASKPSSLSILEASYFEETTIFSFVAGIRKFCQNQPPRQPKNYFLPVFK